MDVSIVVKETIARLVTAWNGGDSLAFCGLFTKEARYIGADGVLRQGRGEIETMFREAIPRIRVSIEGQVSVRRSSGGVEAAFVWTSGSHDQQRRGAIKSLLVMGQEGWRIAALQNRTTTWA